MVVDVVVVAVVIVVIAGRRHHWLVLESPVISLFAQFLSQRVAIKIDQWIWGAKNDNFSGYNRKNNRTKPKILCSRTPIVMGNFYYKVLAQKKGQKAK